MEPRRAHPDPVSSWNLLADKLSDEVRSVTDLLHAQLPTFYVHCYQGKQPGAEENASRSGKIMLTLDLGSHDGWWARVGVYIYVRLKAEKRGGGGALSESAPLTHDERECSINRFFGHLLHMHKLPML